MNESASPHHGGHGTGLVRQMGLIGLAATGICSMLGAAINVIPIMIQRNVPGIGPNVLIAFAFAATPAIFAALAYAVLASAMPRAGGSYVFASRGINPYLGFVASFSQWFGLSIAIGVVAYLIIPFVRDVVAALGWEGLAGALDTGVVRVGLALAFLWIFVGVNLRGVRSYERTLVPMMFIMFALGGIVIIAGFSFDHADFAAALAATEGASIPDTPAPPLKLWTFLAASAVFFSSFIGFDAIAQAGGEARNPRRALPLAIAIAVLTVGTYYMLFAAAIYHAVPWQFMAERAPTQDLTAPGLLGYVLPTGWTVAIVAGAAVALINDLPAMLLSVSRLMFAWAEDGIFPRRLAAVHPRWHTPHLAILVSAGVASAGILGSHYAGDFFLGIDILVTSMLVNFLLMCICVLMLPRKNPAIAADIGVLPARGAQRFVGSVGAVLIGVFLIVHVGKDLTTEAPAWYFHSTWIWALVMAVGTAIFLRERRQLAASGVDLEELYATLPEE
ncbi:MAG: APC family permease [Gemmatimonadota bacterium]|nr:APC family permease [Gemmatimonadota bacterium]